MINNKILILALSSLFMQGCATLGQGKTDYSCTDGSSTGSCLSAIEMYQATNNKKKVTSKDIKEFKEKKMMAEEQAEKNEVVETPQPQHAFVNQARLIQPKNIPMPVRNQTGVARIWIAPWEDSNSRLHSGEFVFNDIETDKWYIGNKTANIFGTTSSQVFSSSVTEKKVAAKKEKPDAASLKARADKELQDFISLAN